MSDRPAAELRLLVDDALSRISELRAQIRAGQDERGHKQRTLQRIELYATIMVRLKCGEALMPEFIQAKERRHEAALGIDP
jgi:hypothetical protein